MTIRQLTLILAYYENPLMLALQIENLSALPSPYRENFELILVDDGSPDHPAQVPSELPFKCRLYRMEVDVPWNQDACRNLGVAMAESDWVLLTDMDMIATPETLKAAILCDLVDGKAYSFGTVTAPKLVSRNRHPNSWLMQRCTYDRAGGYDERYAGCYGTDGRFRRQLLDAAGPIVELEEVLICFGRSMIPDASTTRYERWSPENDSLRLKIEAEIKAP
jgi:glycosyltransferase involved in cell wall biosynthesis